MMRFKLLVTLAAMICFVPLAQATALSGNSGPARFSYEGRVYDSLGNPSSATVSFVVRVLDPGATCLLREEQTAAVNLASTSGTFTVTVGANSLTINDPSLSLAQIFSNSATLTGASTCTYTPSAGDGRIIRILIYDGTTYTTMTPDIAIGSAPYAISADTLQGNAPSSFLMVNSSTAALTQTNLEAIFQSASNVSELSSLVGGTSTLYARPGAANSFTGAVSFTAPPTLTGTPAAANDIVNKNYSDSKIGGQPASSFAGLAAGDSGKVIQWNGSQWVAGTSGAGTVTQIASGPGLSGGPIASAGTLSLSASGVTPGTYSRVTVDTYGRITSATLPVTLAAAGIIDAVQNSGGVPAILSGADAAKPAPGTAGRIFLATDTLKIYRDNGSSYDLMASATGSSPGGSAGGDLSATYPNPVVARIQNVPVSLTGPSIGQVLKYISSNWQPSSIFVGDLRSSITGPLFPTTNCTAGQTLQYFSATDNFACTNLSSFPMDVAFSSTGALTVPNGSAALRPTTPNNGMIRFNTTTNTFEAFNTAWVQLLMPSPSGMLGVGTSSPSAKFHVLDAPIVTSGNFTSAMFNSNPNPPTSSTAIYAGANLLASSSSPNLASATLIGALDQAMAGSSASGVIGTFAQAHFNGSTSANQLIGVEGVAANDGIGSVSNAMGVYARVDITGGGSIANAYGLFVDTFPASGATNKWAIYSADSSAPSAISGALSIGSSALPAEVLQVTGNIKATGQLYGNVNTVASGAVADANSGNTIIFTSAGAAILAVNNMRTGGTYTVIVQDSASRTYTFSSCGTSRFNPANAATTLSTHTIYKILYAGSTCYIDWKSGY
jgi:hypothetical protein